MFPHFLSFFNELWSVLQSSGWYILFGFFAAGLIHTFVPTNQIVTLLGKRNWKSVLNASLVGIPLPLCSCSVLPTAVTLRKKGASRGATSSFLVSTPETGLDSIALTYGLMDISMTVLRPLSAFITAMVAGLSVNWFGSRDNTPAEPAKPSCCCSHNTENAKHEEKQKPFWLFETFRFAYFELVNDLAQWLALGFVLSAMIAAWMPAAVFEGWAGQGFTSLIFMLVISMPMYICASASTPIAATLIAKGLSPGAAIVFLLAGPATNIGSIPLLTNLLGKRSVVLYLGSIFAVSLIIGMGVNWAFAQYAYSPIMAVQQHHEHGGSWTSATAGIILALLILNGLRKKFIPKIQRILFPASLEPEEAKCCGK